ncbi:MAG: hypothetical protein IKV62_00495 [Bacteroidales bacterium]|nr:hypothetical protein [Bacteroidales bacterium]
MGKFRKVYVLAPAGKTTGGVELAHQLVDALTGMGQEAYVVYVDKDGLAPGSEVPEMYRKYRVRVSETVEDSPENMLVLPEIYFDYLYRFPSIRIGCWWMSVDNHYYSACLTDMLRFPWGLKERKDILYRYLVEGVRFRNSVADLRRQSDRIVHFYQSAYALDHLTSLGFQNVAPLSDYIHPDLFVSSQVPKEDIILYNPKKGKKYVEMLRKRLPDCSFIPLQGFSREQLNEVFDRAKLYVDFGPFPGKDRIPREAVLHGCCLITGRFGASAFYEDVPIPDTYKFSMKGRIPWEGVTGLVRRVFAEYDACCRDFDPMRERIGQEREIFIREATAYFL